MTAEPISAVLDRAWPEVIRESRRQLADQFLRREIDWPTLLHCWPPAIAGENDYRLESLESHLTWARKALAGLDVLALEAKPEELAKVAALRADILSFAGDAEGLRK